MKAEAIAGHLATLIEEDSDVMTALAQNPTRELAKLAKEVERRWPVYTQDKFVYRLAVSVLGALALIAAVGSVILVLYDSSIPESLVALGSAAVGALVGLFATPPNLKPE